MTWLAFKVGWKKFWSFMRRYGWIFIVVAVLIVAAILSAGNRKVIGRLWSIIRNERELHQERVDEIDKINDEEIESRERAARRAVAAVKAAEEQFRERNEELDKKKKRDIEKLVKAHDDDPEALARKLADQFGLVFTPSE